MTGFFPEGAVDHLRGLHLEVAVILVDAAHELFNNLPDRPALGVPEDHARGFVLQMKEIELFTESAVIALFGFREHFKVGVLFFFRRPGRTVDALQHFVFAVAPPVGTRDLHELKDLEFAG